MDKLDHASIIDAVKASGADFRTYRRGDLGRVGKLLSREDHRRKFIVSESVFSMDGDKADLVVLAELKDKYGGVLIVDEAHAVGCLGNNCAGLADELGVLDRVDIVVGTMSKALGSGGGFVTAPEVVIKSIVNKARSFIYTTAATVPNCAAALKAIEIIKAEPERREKLKKNCEYLRKKLDALKLDTGQSSTHIIPVIIGSEARTLAISKMLLDEGYFVAAIRPPTVAANTSRLRISLQANHTTEQMDGLVEALERSMGKD
jgi:8-amino-7-oxononanoate synthase